MGLYTFEAITPGTSHPEIALVGCAATSLWDNMFDMQLRSANRLRR